MSVERKERKAYASFRQGIFRLGNAYLDLVIETSQGINPTNLQDRRTGRLYADADYIYRLTPELSKRPTYQQHRIRTLKDGSKEVTVIGKLGPVQLEHRFRVSPEKPYIEEQITLANTGREELDTSQLAFGFAKRLKSVGEWVDGLERCRLVAVPYRREFQGKHGEYEDYSFDDLLSRGGWYRARWNAPKITTPQFGSEGWTWTDGDMGLLIVKHNKEAMEFSLVEPVSQLSILRFGGAGIWKLGDPEVALSLKPNQRLTFGITRYILFEGGWKGGYYAFRGFMEEMGHGYPKDFDPPVHWNELYDNPLWWGQDTTERRQQFYKMADMEQEAMKARELGCEALYLDPGWDTSFASSIWAEDRLGKQTEFVRMLKEKYGLKLALHNPLSGWTDINAYPLEARCKDEHGNLLSRLCGASPAYVETKAQRLLKLCEDGAAFLMFDGTAYTGPCYDQVHRHSIPLRREEHCRAIHELAWRVHERFPHVIIELHDPVFGGVPEHYAPTYHLHALPGGFDEIWAFEYMWNPMDDLLSGRAISLYYYNLAYSLPAYLHIDLRKDNEHALIFWWYASTCRHLGVGGKHPDPNVWDAHKRAMKEYLRLKRFYTQGKFYGVDETVHVHVLRDKGQGRSSDISRDAADSPVAVLNVFNLGDIAVQREISFRLEDIGLPPGLKVSVLGAPSLRRGSLVTMIVELPARGHRLLELREEIGSAPPRRR